MKIYSKCFTILFLILFIVFFSRQIFAAEKVETVTIQLKGYGEPESGIQFSLTSEEKAFLDSRPKIRIGVMNAWPPMNFLNESGQPSGLGADYIKALNQRLGNILEIVPGPFKENLEQVKAKHLDALMDVTPKPEREAFLNFTRTYLNIPHVIVARRDGPYYATEDDLNGETLALEKGFYNIKYFRKKYPGVKIKEYTDTALTLDAVARGRADAYAGNRAVAAYIMEQELISNLQFQGRLNKPGSILAIGVRKDWPELATILDKTLAAIPMGEVRAIRRRWAGMDITTGDRSQARLTAGELAWIQTHPRIKVNGGGLPPFIIRASDGETRGISTQILEMAASNVGITVEYVDGPWSVMMEMIKSRELDLLQCVSKSPDREKFIHFTGPYLDTLNAIYVQKRNGDIRSIIDLKGKTLAVLKASRLNEFLISRYPEIRLLPVTTPVEGLRKINDGDAAAYIGNLILFQYEMQKRLISNLKIAAHFDEISSEMRLGARKDYKVLADIMQKALDTVTENQKQQIISRYITLADKAPADVALQPDTMISYQRLAAYSIGVFLLISLLFLLLIRIMRREHIAVSFGSPWFRRLVLAGLSVFIIMVTLAGWIMHERTKRQHLSNIGATLRGNLNVIQNQLNQWREERIAYMKRLGNDPALVDLTRSLLKVKPQKRALLASDALKAARIFFEYTGGMIPNIGFFVINPDHISIGSMRDANIGTRNLISEQNPGVLERAFQGKVGFVPPLTSDVHLDRDPSKDAARKPPTMFFIGPIKDDAGRILAVMTLSVDPQEDFARMFRMHGAYKTHDSYAFDREGRMLSPSRFEDQLRRIGLLGEKQNSALNIDIRNPGVNLIEGGRPNLERPSGPLTHMALQAIALRQPMEMAGIQSGHSQIEWDAESYRDYRGVPVYGSWLWNRDLDIGLAAEIEVSEALSSFEQIRLTVFGILGFTLLLSAGSVLLVLVLGERTSRALMRARDQLEEKVAQRTAELKDNQERFRLILESVGEGIFGVDLQGKVLFINSAASRLLGYEPDELIGQDVHGKIHHTHADGSPYPADTCPMSKAYTHGMTETISDEMLWRKDGAGFSVEYTATPMIRDKEISGAVIAFRDITDRKRMEETLSTERERLQGILDTSPVGVGISSEGVMRFANPRMIQLFGMHPGDPLPQVFVDPEDRIRIVAELKKNKIVQDYELQMFGRKGEVLDILASYMVAEFEGQEAVLGWLIDITELKKTDQERREKFDELARFRRLAVGREKKMIELKKEINEILNEHGIPKKYKIH